ncbi:MAG: hypothetical protein AAF389_07700 [Gemmatimonadota bacterium]
MRSTIFRAVGLALAMIAGATPLLAQSAQLGQQSLRPYWHVFAAYALVIVIVGAWAFSIGKRLRDVESRLAD